MKRRGPAVLVLVVLVLVGAACVSPIPTPAVSKHIQTVSAGFALDLEDGRAHCAMEYKVRAPFSRPLDLRIEFESPDPGGAPLVAEHVLEPSEQQFAVDSPDYPSLRNGYDYSVVLRGYSRATPPQLWFEHRDLVRLSVPSELFEQIEQKLAR